MIEVPRSYHLQTWCPHCGVDSDTHAHALEEREPHRGAVSICWHCLGMAMFDQGPLGNLILRAPTEPERLALEQSTDLAEIRRHGARELDPLLAVSKATGERRRRERQAKWTRMRAG